MRAASSGVSKSSCMRSTTRHPFGAGFEKVSKIAHDELAFPFDGLALKAKGLGRCKVFKIGRFKTENFSRFIELEDVCVFESCKPLRHRHIVVS